MKKVVLSLSGHDPTGGAGIQADIETLQALGLYPCTIITALTVQDSVNVQRIQPISTALIQAQLHTLMNDITVDCFKIGLLGHASLTRPLQALLTQYPDTPAVLDPILRAGGGKPLANDALKQSLIALLPQLHIITPNLSEAQQLSGQQHPDDCATWLSDHGARFVLMTDTDTRTTHISHRLYQQQQCLSDITAERLPYSYHGSGCTLAAALAGFIAQGLDLLDAVQKAHDFSWHSLRNGLKIGRGQHFPQRIPPYDDQ
jgi:hydroxymethylpyrimidine/phosphomethylpyrimidine kinase